MQGTIKKTMSELDRIPPKDYAAKNQGGLVVVLDNIRSAHNVGSIFRTSDAMGVSTIYLCGITCSISNRELQKTALGAELSVPSEQIAHTVDIVQKLKSEGYIVYVLEQTHSSIMLHSDCFHQEKKYAFVFGNEVEGVSDEVIALSNACIEIPQIGTKHSLNVANASAIVLWEFFKSRRNECSN